MSYLELIDVCLGYKEESTIIPVLKGVSLKIEAGDFVSIIGPSGSGKSTLLKAIGGLAKPFDGEIVVGGKAIGKLDSKEREQYRNKTLGFVFQDFRLISCLTAVENVMIPLLIANVNKHEARKRAEKLLEEVGLSDCMHSYPEKMSGGEQQRVAIARALANNPDLILADEPTGNLDTATRDSILALFKKMNEAGKTIVMVTHDGIATSYTERVIDIDDFRYRERGPVAVVV